MLDRFAAVATLSALLSASPVAADSISAEIGSAGLGPTEARLAALPTPSDDERLALGAVQFLRAIEGSFQTRYAYGLTDRSGFVPLLRLGLTDNPAPEPFDPHVITRIFAEAEAGLARAITTLTALPATSPAALELGLGDIWFDVNQSTTRDPGEGMADIVGTLTLGISPAEAGMDPPALPVIRFDSADAAWAAAYAHLLSGLCEIVQAYDPSGPIATVMEARAGLAEFGPTPPSFLSGMDQAPDEIDLIAMILATLNQPPDRARMAKAHGHFLQMIAQNRAFWARVEGETDNDREWLPNDRQVAALGVSVPPETGKMWQAVLADAEALLTGQKLIPYWRAGDLGGINLQKVFLDPRPVDLAGWLQGWAALPYMQTGPHVSAESWSAFENMLMGDAMLFAIWFN